MPVLIPAPSVIEVAGNRPKRIEEFAGRVNSGHAEVSVARMQSPEGWVEPGQRPEFQEITVVLRGMLRVEHEGGAMEVRAGQAIVQHAGEWVRYSTPEPGGAEYVPSAFPPSPPPPSTATRTDGPRCSSADAGAGVRECGSAGVRECCRKRSRPPPSTGG